MDPDGDPVVHTLTVRFSNMLAQNIHVQQFPLLNRPLEVPPSAALSGKRMKARHKPAAQRFEIHVPVDTRTEVWNAERARELGAGRVAEDRDHDSSPSKLKEVESPRLSEVRLRSERISNGGSYMLGIIREGQLHLHPIEEVHQMRPTLTYLDILSRRQRRHRGDDTDAEDGPPADLEEPTPGPSSNAKDKRPPGEAKDVQVAARKTDERSGQGQGGISSVRREMLDAMRREDEEQWVDYGFFESQAAESLDVYEKVFSHEGRELVCASDVTSFLRDI